MKPPEFRIPITIKLNPTQLQKAHVYLTNIYHGVDLPNKHDEDGNIVEAFAPSREYLDAAYKVARSTKGIATITIKNDGTLVLKSLNICKYKRAKEDDK